MTSMASLWLFFRLVFSTLAGEINKGSSTSLFCKRKTAESHTPSLYPIYFPFFFKPDFPYVLTGPRHLASFALLQNKNTRSDVSSEMRQTLGRLKGWFWGMRDWVGLQAQRIFTLEVFFLLAKNATSPASPCWL